MSLDFMNACFELVGACFVWSNVRALLRDRHIAGVNLSVTGFYVAWGMSSLVYYAHLGHWWSLAGNLGILSANVVWLALAIHYRRQK